MNDTTPLFTPFTLNNGVEIKNRLVAAPMTHHASNPDGTLSDKKWAFLAYLSQRRLWYTQAVKPLSGNSPPIMRAIWQA